jgi:hypothetical protein
MSTAIIETPETATRRTPSQRRTPTSSAAKPQLVEARQHAETAVSDLAAAATDAVRAFVPAALLRPTEAVDFAFDLAEQMLAVSRRACLEAAQILENGL